MGPTWDPSGAVRTQVGPMNFVLWEFNWNWYLVNIGSGDGTKPSGKKPLLEPMSIYIHDAILIHTATMSDKVL